MSSRVRLLAFILVVALAATAACYITIRLSRPKYIGDAVAYHYWVHDRLGLTDDQETALEPIEANFTEKRNRLVADIRSANKELAAALRSDRTNSPRVTIAVEKIHAAQGKLQNAVLDHIFEMQPVLTKEQYEELIRLTAEALEAEPASE